jgi:type VI secretion system secreted protein Hcp
MNAFIKNTFAALVLPTCAALALLATTPTSDAAAYMKIGAIKGEATDSDHTEWIELSSINLSISRTLTTDSGTGATQRRGDVVLGDISCVKELDKSSPKIAEAICTGQHFGEVTIHLCISVDVPQPDGSFLTKQEPYLKYKLTNVMVTSYNVSGASSGEPLPTEEVTLGYTEVEWTYIVLDKDTKQPTGEEVTGWCVATEGS